MKRATNAPNVDFIIFDISIHALVKRATGVKKTFQNLNYISIHALVKMATIIGAYIFRIKFHFNPRPREEGDKTAERGIYSC